MHALCYESYLVPAVINIKITIMESHHVLYSVAFMLPCREIPSYGSETSIQHILCRGIDIKLPCKFLMMISEERIGRRYHVMCMV